MNQILVNEHDPKKKQEDAEIDNLQPSNELKSNFDSIDQTFDVGQNSDSIDQPYDMYSGFDNIQQSYDSMTNIDGMQQPFDSQPSFDSMQQPFDSQSSFDSIGQLYESQSNYDNVQSSYGDQVAYDMNQSYNNAEMTYGAGQNYDNIQPAYNSEQNYTNEDNFNNYIGDNSKTLQKVEIKKVIRIFCIVIIIFSLVLGGKAIFSVIKTKNSKKDTPIVNIDKMGREATISITTQKPIKEYSYQWNKDGEPEVEQGNGSVSIEKTIQIPNGNNILNITVTDYYGNKTKYFKQYIYESTDIIKPTINLATVGNKLKIIAEDDTEMLYITYSWNDEEIKRVDVTQDDKKTIEVEIEVPEGQNRLTINAVDKEENKEIRIENIIGDDKPTFDLQTDGENIIVIAKDDQGVSKISITIDDVTTDSGETPINQTEVTAKLPISRGTHTITVTVTNINGLSETNTVTHTF